MKAAFKLLTVGLAVVAASALAPRFVAAQEIPETTAVRDALTGAFFDDSRDFYGNQTAVRRMRESFGTGRNIFRRGNYAEINVERDAKRVNAVYNRLMQEQVASDPTLRVIDLPNPFETSLLVEPSLYTNQATGTEFVFERSPIR
ncbi:MAG: hypothetical protein HC857_07030 [Synechococcales cyanobacterium RU_4_20]|nr:hypothetical protein [Synechococcales cyanobacterium RU_4_20]NJR67225.1 hypothetical protein [Synechococcales cyanobacterium CRU_2_2]